MGNNNIDNSPGRRESNNVIRIVMAATAIILLLSGYSTAQTRETGTLQNFKRGDALPSIELSTLIDSTVQHFSPKNDRPSVIMFFSIRPDFRKKRSLVLLSTFSDLADQYKTKINIIGIYSDSKEKETVQTYMTKSAISIPVYHDRHKDIYDKYGVFMMPLVVLTDNKGRLHEVIPYTYNIRGIIDGNIKYLLGEWDKNQLARSLKPKPSKIRSNEEKEYIRRINYGRIMQSKKMYDQAIRELSNAVTLMPNLIEGHTGLGFAYIKTKQFEKAEVHFNDALKINPESDEAIAGLGLSYYGQGKTESALEELEKAFITKNPSIDVIVSLAEIYEEKGLDQKAIRLNKLAVSILMTMYEQRWK